MFFYIFFISNNNVLVAPVITNFNLPEKALEGRNVSFICESEGIPSPQIQWYRAINSEAKEPISESDKYLIKPNGEMIINSASSHDRGTYICTANNSLNVPDSRNVTLEVIGKILKNLNRFCSFPF